MKKRIDFSLHLLLFWGLFLYSPYSSGQAANRKIDSLRSLIVSARADTDKVTLLITMSKIVDCNDSSLKLRYAATALKIAEKIGWEKGIVNADLAIGNIYDNCIRNFEAATTYFQKAVSIAKASGDKTNQANALVDMAEAYFEKYEYGAALAYCKQVLELAPSAEVVNGVLGNMGIIYTKVADYPNALICYDSSLKITDDLIRKSKAEKQNYKLQKGGLLIDIGNIYMAMSEHDHALENYTKAQRISAETKNELLGVLALRCLGKTYLYETNYKRSIQYYSAALEKSEKSGERTNEAGIYNELAVVYLEAGAVDQALESAQSAMRLADENNYIALLPVVYTTLGKIYTVQKKYKAALSYLQKAVSICGKDCALNDEMNAWEVLSSTYDKMNQPRQALDAYRHYILIRDSVYNIEVANKLTRETLRAEYGRQKLAADIENNMRMQKQMVYTISGYAGFAVVLLLAFFIYRNYTVEKKANVIVTKANETINEEKQKSEMLLLNILPEDVATELKSYGRVRAKLFDHVTVLFTDFVNFTEAGERLSPEKLVDELDNCFKAFDEIIGKYNIEKIKTVGDAYVAASGLPQPNRDHAADIVMAAIEFSRFMIDRRKELGDQTFAMRIGINSGTVVAGIVGVRKFAYDIWGDTVNTAARMEQYSQPDKINISQSTYDLVKDRFKCVDRGTIDAKNKGKIRMYFVEV